jgi:hypothetical protein
MRVGLSFLLGIVIAAPLAAQEKPRIYIAASAAWRQHDEGAEGGSKEEPEIRTVEIAASFSRSCGGVTITADYKMANYIAEFSHRGTAVPLTHFTVNRTDVNIFRFNADLVGGSSKSTLGAAVKAACEVIKKDWPEAPHEVAPRPPHDARPAGRPTALEQ